MDIVKNPNKHDEEEESIHNDENIVPNKKNFIRQFIDEDIISKNISQIITRFPPEPNGFLHIGHAKAILISSNIAKDYNGQFNLRFDDTNPEKESLEYVEAIKKDVKWLGADWHNNLFYSSNYFSQLYDLAIKLIEQGNAFVCDLTAEQMREYRGNLNEPGKNSPYRNRSIEENLRLFQEMKNGVHADGAKSLRAKIDMAAPNINMRDPVIYRIKKISHHNTGNSWCIYPMYDFTHPLSDSFEKITHSLCTLEFEGHRPLYDWFCKTLEVYHPRQIEFSRLNLDYTVMSKRKLVQLVEQRHVKGWDDPRLPTIAGMRRRGYTPESIQNFCKSIGVTKKDSIISMGTLESAVREHLNILCDRKFAILNPLKVTITNWEEDFTQEIAFPNHPLDESRGTRSLSLSKEIYISRDDFKEEASRKFRRLKSEGYVRLRFAYVIKCDQVIKDLDGNITELKCSYIKETFGGVTPEGMKKVKGIIGWVSKKSSLDAEIRMYDRLFDVSNPSAEEDFKTVLNQNSLKVEYAKVESTLVKSQIGDRFQFERVGYFRVDEDTTSKQLIFNQIVTLKDNWELKEKSGKK